MARWLAVLFVAGSTLSLIAMATVELDHSARLGSEVRKPVRVPRCAAVGSHDEKVRAVTNVDERRRPISARTSSGCPQEQRLGVRGASAE